MGDSFSQIFSNFSGASLQSEIKRLSQHPVARTILSSWERVCQRLGIPGVPGLVTIILVLLVMSKSADITWNLLEPSDPGAALNESGFASSQKNIPILNLTNQIIALHLFGKAEKKVVKKPKVKTKVKEREVVVPLTPLNLTLFGVFVEGDPDKSTAIIGKSAETQQFYHVGDAVSSGAKLVEVNEESVTLSRNGRNEVLRFPEQGGVPGLLGKFSKPRFSRTAPAPKIDATLYKYREMIKSAPQEIFKYIRFTPVVKGKVRSGFRMFPMKDQQFFNKLGIKSSDIVTEVNGISLDNSLRAGELMEELSDSDELELEIIRNGRKQTITLGE